MQQVGSNFTDLKTIYIYLYKTSQKTTTRQILIFDLICPRQTL